MKFAQNISLTFNKIYASIQAGLGHYVKVGVGYVRKSNF